MSVLPPEKCLSINYYYYYQYKPNSHIFHLNVTHKATQANKMIYLG